MVPPVPADPKLSFPGILLGVGHELRDRLGRHGGMNLHHDRQIGDQRQQAEILHGVVGQLLVEQRIEHEDRRRREEQRVAVGLGARRGFGADRALRAGLVLDHDGLLQVAAEIFADHAAEHVGRAARGIGHDQLDRTHRIFRRMGVAARPRQGCRPAPIISASSFRFPEVSYAPDSSGLSAGCNQPSHHFPASRTISPQTTPAKIERRVSMNTAKPAATAP